MAAVAALPLHPDTLGQARHLHAQGQFLQAAESYRHALLEFPLNQSALLGLSLIARQTGQFQPALRMAQAALAAHPKSALAWANFGDALIPLGHLAPALSAFQRALALDCNLAPAHYGLGNALAHQDNFVAALASFNRAVELAPHSPECHFAQGFAQGKLGRHCEAILAYRHALRLRPGFPSAWLNLGVELIADGRAPLAAHCYHQALASSSHAASTHAVDQQSTPISALLNLGHLARSHSRFPEAQAHYLRALDLAQHDLPQPDPRGKARLSEIYVACAYLHLEQQQFPQAWISIRAAEAANPAHPNAEIPNARGILLLAEESAATDPASVRQSLIEQAIAAFSEAESQGHKTAASNRGNALLRLGRVTEALAAHQAARGRGPHHPGVRYNLALTQLRAGDFTQGWPNYEIRWQFREVHPRPRRFAQPRWHGEPLSGPTSLESAPHQSSTLFLYAEQGLGDTIQFVRYLPLVAQRLPNVPLILEVQPALLRLLSANLAGLPVQLVAHGDRIPRFTHHCPLMSLPAIFQTTVETVPAAIPYLHPPAATTEAQENTFPRHPLTVGLNWAGNPRYRADRDRSTTLETFLPLLALPNIRWISLQKGEAASQIARIPSSLRPLDAGSGDRDLADTASQIAGLDLVLTTDTAIAHLTGALGKPLWLLLPWQSDWRWMQETPRTPWYPSARLWRQSSPQNWPELIHRVRRELEHGIAASGL